MSAGIARQDAALRRSLTTLTLPTGANANTGDRKPSTNAPPPRGDIESTVPIREDGAGDPSIDDDEGEDEHDVESTKRLSLQQQLEMLRGKLARRNKILEVVRRAYYHDVIVVKEELRHVRQQQPSTLHSYHTLGSQSTLSFHHSSTASLAIPPSSSRSTTSGAPPSSRYDDRLASVPSIDLRDVLPLFAPSETVLKVHPCETCGGHLELVHGESKELMAARQEMARATKGEAQMKTIVHRLRVEAKEMEDVNEALQQRVKALVKENSYALEQLQAARKIERDQKAILTTLRSKLQLAQNTQEDLDHLTAEYKDVKQQLIRSNHDRDIFSASNNHLKEELSEVNKMLHQVKVEKAQIESDFGLTHYKLQEELKTTRQLREDLANERAMLNAKTALSDELQKSLTTLKDEFAVTLQRTEQAKRQLEDQLADEERSIEEMQEQNLEFRKTNKRLLKELEQLQRDPLGLSSPSDFRSSGNGSTAAASTSNDPKTLIRKKIEGLQMHLEAALMREHDLLGLLTRQRDAATPAPTSAATPSKPQLRKKLSRMPSTTVITRFVPPPDTPAGSTNGVSNETSSSNSGNSGNGENSEGSGEVSRRRPRFGRGGSDEWSGSPSELAEAGEDGMADFDEKSFEAYHQEIHHLMVELEEGKDKHQKQQKVITDLERKNQTLLDRLEESKLAIETLNGSLTALKSRLNQDNAGAAEQLEDMARQIEDGKLDQLYESERGIILIHFLRAISNEVFRFSENQALEFEFDLERPVIEEENSSESYLSPELLMKKRELRKKVLMDKAMKKFSQLCHSRAEIIALEIKKLTEHLDRLRMDLDQAENKIDSDQFHIRTLEAEVSKLKLTIEVGRTNFARSERALKIVSDELQSYQTTAVNQTEEIKTMKQEIDTFKEDERRLTMILFEKTKAWEKEIGINEKVRLSEGFDAMSEGFDAMRTYMPVVPLFSALNGLPVSNPSPS
ncbi:hypothetical protein Poli38472_013838 [Pythium oligandrum]|uniref:Uncharacterized protein n=1 Tax=Pythium oligandrum TaxID=41045 RepID=A0A8K1C264_PYTOL|nr:hypothetical protein Poli38472_013838 [Pythium oligandrum]|eukprot:TMW55076.1 hypothetical protein Poli38472_013838 [Pythium oligandrum]